MSQVELVEESVRRVSLPDPYRYQSRQESFLLPFYRRALWDRLLPTIPTRVSPNTLTVSGAVCCALAFGITVAGPPEGAWSRHVSAALLIFVYMTLDDLDGRHARRIGRSSHLGEYLDHWLDTISNGLIVVGVSRAIQMPATVTLVVLAFSNVSFFVVHWRHHRAGTMRLGRVSEIEGLTTVVLLYLACALFGATIFQRSPVLGVGLPIAGFAVAMGLQAVWAAADALITVRSGRADWIPLVTTTGAILLWSSTEGVHFWPLGALLALTNVLCAGRPIADRVRPVAGSRYDIAGALVAAAAAAIVLAGVGSPSARALLAWGAVAGFGTLAASDALSTLRTLRRR